MKAYGKSILRTLAHSKARSAAIFAIVALGAGFAAGVFSVAPQMRQTVDSYLDKQNFMDAEVLSTLGFSQNDVKAALAAKGVEAVMPTWTEDVMSRVGDEDMALRIHALPEKGAENTDADSLNRPVLISGRWPKSADECVLNALKFTPENGLKIGDTVTTQEQGETKLLKTKEFRIVGFVQSPMYLSYTLGTTNIGNGQLSHFLYVMPEAFGNSDYTALSVRVKGASSLACFTQEYKDFVQPSVDALEAVGKTRASLRRDEVIAEPQKKLSDSRADYKVQKADAEKKLADSKKKLDDAEAEIAKNKTKLADSEKNLADGGKALADSRKKYESGLVQYNAQKEDAESKLAAAEANLKQSRAELEASKQKLAEAEKQLTDGEAQLAEAQKELDASPVKPEGAQQQLDAQAASLKASREGLEKNKAVLDAKEKELASGEAAFQKQKSDTEAKLAAAKKELDDANAKLTKETASLASGKRQLADGKAQLAEAEKQLSSGQSNYKSSKKETEEKLSDAEKKISDAQKKIDKVENTEWYVLDRSKNAGYYSFTSDADRMAAIAKMFPVFFFLVAALVVLTTMTRMVEEERSEIGAYKALGFSRARITRRYTAYAAVVSLAGGLFGVAVGCLTLPSACWNAYRILYVAPAIDPPRMDWGFASLSCLAAVAVAVAATLASCRAVVGEKPAALLQPLAPKPGRRILLERISFLWKRMNFSAKVTARNLFRYKKRLGMTVAGIAGCTALLLTGFGLQDSIAHIVSYQFDDIDHYNLRLTLQHGGISDGASALLNDKTRVARWAEYSSRVCDAESDSGASMSVYVVVPKKAAALPQFLSLRDRRTQKPVSFGKNSVVVTEKLAKQLGLSAGSRVTVEDGAGKKHAFTVTGVVENYIYHYVYIDPDLYRSVTGRSEESNEVWAQDAGLDANGRQALSRALLANSDVGTATFLNDISSTFDTLIRALDVIVFIFIFCAASLSFVVLYNLTNINITERAREMATLRVLGFTVRECEAYIYRETTFLTVLGCALGLVLGIFMHAAVITTVEVDVCMFPRDIAPLSYLWSVALTFLFTFFVDFIMRSKFRKIDMVESLKSVD